LNAKTDHTEIERAAELRERLAAIIESSYDAIISKTLQGVITSWNRGAERIFGYSAREAVGRSMLMLIPPERAGEERELLAKLARGERVDHFETVRVHKDGTHIDISAAISPIRDAEGRIVGASKIARDISERKKIERERAQFLQTVQTLNAGLEDRVRERTNELRDLVSALETFTYAVAHDLRTPLGVISNFAGLIDHDYGGSLPDDGRRLLRHIAGNAQKMAKLLDDLLGFARLGYAPIQRVSVDMAQVALRAQQELFALHGLDGVEFHLQALPPCRGDPGLLGQVWANLLSNATKFSRTSAPPRIEIGFDAGQLAYWIRDNGVGFDMKHASMLFGIFQRLHGEEQYEGAGVGLAISERIVQRHGGRIWAEARPDGGATFYFTVSQAAADPAG
jgi:PAS domain S-box-containing protein